MELPLRLRARSQLDVVRVQERIGNDRFLPGGLPFMRRQQLRQLPMRLVRSSPARMRARNGRPCECFGALLRANSQRRDETERNDEHKKQRFQVSHLFKLLIKDRVPTYDIVVSA